MQEMGKQTPLGNVLWKILQYLKYYCIIKYVGGQLGAASLRCVILVHDSQSSDSTSKHDEFRECSVMCACLLEKAVFP